MLKKFKKISTILGMSFLLAFTPCKSAFAEEYTRSEEISLQMQETYILSDEELLYKEVPILSLCAENISPDIDTELDYTEWWYSEWEDCHYIFLPSTAERSALTITYETEKNLPVYLDGRKITSGETVDLSKTDVFNVTVDGIDCGKLKIMQSEIGCIYITTSTGGLDMLDTYRSSTDTGSVLMINADGSIEYNGELEKITPHGNSSWDYSKKKSYNFKLPKKQNLYGMGKAKKWTLLSNYLDHSMLRNAVAAEMGRNTGMEYIMDYIYVDLYADGSYRGTYQLSERVQIQKNRVNITDLEEITEDLNSEDLEDYKQKTVGASSPLECIENSYKYYDIPVNPSDITGGYLLQFQAWNRYGNKAESGFVTSKGQAVEIDSPEYASEAQVLYIREFVQDLENAIYSDNGYNSKGKHYSEYIDVDSLIRAYLIQEIMMNVDSTVTSFYFWKDSDITGDGKIHFSPVWDMDFSCSNFYTYAANSDGDVGHSTNTNNLFTAYFPISGYNVEGNNCNSYGISWIGQLYKYDDDFRKHTAEVYFKDFYPYLQELIDTDIMQWAENIQSSAEMNNARWHMYGGKPYKVFGSKNGDNFIECTEYVINFLSKRSAFLNKLWKPLVDVKGDANGDGVCSIADAVMVQKYILGAGNITLWKNVDLCNDNKIDVYDYCILLNMIK